MGHMPFSAIIEHNVWRACHLAPFMEYHVWKFCHLVQEFMEQYYGQHATWHTYRTSCMESASFGTIYTAQLMGNASFGTIYRT
jgi:hypothetical protein